jgi:uncharacterized protein
MTQTKADVMDAENNESLPAAESVTGGLAGPELSVANADIPADSGITTNPSADGTIQASGADYYPLDPRFIPLSKLIGLIITGVVAVIGVVALGVFWFASGFTWIWWVAAAAFVLILGMLLWLSFFWPQIEHRHYFWRLDETGLEIVRGVYWRHRISVPIARLQHADISQGPIQRQFGLAKLTVHTAGTSNASVEIDGLAYETATWLRDQLIRQREELDVV